MVISPYGDEDKSNGNRTSHFRPVTQKKKKKAVPITNASSSQTCSVLGKSAVEKHVEARGYYILKRSPLNIGHCAVFPCLIQL